MCDVVWYMCVVCGVFSLCAVFDVCGMVCVVCVCVCVWCGVMQSGVWSVWCELCCVVWSNVVC